MDMKIVWFCALVLSLDIVESQYSNSPCPNFFDFESDGNQIYGRIILRGSVPVPSLVLRINFTVAAQLYSNYVGRLEAENSNSLLQTYNSGLPVRYRVHFPVTRPLPKLTALTVNGETVCYGPGDVPRPNSYVTTLSLQHTSFLQGGGPLGPVGPVYNNFPPPRRPDPVEVNQYGDDAQVFTFNNIEPPGWNNGGNSPYYVVNNTQPTRPVYQQPTQVYQPSRPIYEQDEQVQDERPQYRPQKPAKPVYQPVTKRPVYQAPATRPPPPPKQENFYYPEPETEAPRPATPRPVYRKPESQSAIPECGTVAGGNERVPLIFHGKGYPRGDVPWLVAIYKSDGGTLGFTCGGTLVSNRHVITAAHCMYNREMKVPIKDFVVKVGVHNLNDWGDDITVTRTLIAADIHETYNASTLERSDPHEDFFFSRVVFTFNKRVTFNTYIRAACLWSGSIDQNLIVGATGVVAGWGDQSGPKQGEPQMVHLPVVSTAVCRASKPDFHLLTSETTLCAGDRTGAGPCRGDSGGGLYLLDGGKWRLRGVVSVSLRAVNSESVCNLNEYLIFTDTAQYLPWIRRVMSENYFD